MNSLNQKILNVSIKISFIFAVSSIVLLILGYLGAPSRLLDLIAPSEDFFVPRTYREIRCNILPLLLVKFSVIALLSAIISIIISVIKRKEGRLRVNRKLLITSLVFASICLFTVTTVIFCWARTRDSFRREEMRLMTTAQELYFYDNDEYLTYDGSGDGTPTIGKYLQALDDPQAPDKHYTWMNNKTGITCFDNNIDSGEWFCVYAELDDKVSCVSTAYLVVSNHGVRVVCDSKPTISGDCTCFDKKQPFRKKFENWSIYKNEKYGYEIKYPPTSTLEELDQSKKLVVSGPYDYIVLIRENVSSLEELKSLEEDSFQKMLERSPEYLPESPDIELTWKDTIVSGKSAVEGIVEIPEPFYPGTYYTTNLIKDSIAYSIRFTGFKVEKVYYRILSSFQLLD